MTTDDDRTRPQGLRPRRSLQRQPRDRDRQRVSVISHEYGHSLGLPDFYSTGGRETYGDWNLMATDKSHNIDAFGRQELGWVVPEVLDSDRTETGITDSKQDTDTITWQTPGRRRRTRSPRGRRRRSRAELADVRRQAARPRLLDPAKFDTGDKATRLAHLVVPLGQRLRLRHGPGKGHNFDLAIPEAGAAARRARRSSSTSSRCGTSSGTTTTASS